MNQKYNILFLLSITIVSAMGGYLFGFDFAVITGGLPFLVDKFGLDPNSEGATTASLAIGCIIGCIIAGGLSDKYGRKPSLLTAAAIFAISSIFMGIAPSLPAFITGRFFAGIGVGMASMLSPMYIAEISPASLRGRMVSINQLTIVLGIVITHLVNYSLKNLGPDAWRWMFGSGAIPSTLFLLGVLFIPESPRWLVKEGKDKNSLTILKRIGGEDYASESLSEIKKSIMGEKTINYKELLGKTLLRILLIGIGLAIFQQWCGINVVFNYTAKIFESIGADRSEQLLQAVYIGIVNLIFTIIAISLVDKLGRKPLMLFGAGGLAILYLIIAYILKINAGKVLSPFILAAISTYALSLAPVTWVLISEIFPNKIRGRATSIAVIALWGAYAVLVWTFPVISEKLGNNSAFYIYSLICLLGFLFILFKVKETKGKTLEEIEKEFKIY